MYWCETCVHSPPSSCDGKPCTQCNPDDPYLNCYEKADNAGGCVEAADEIMADLQNTDGLHHTKQDEMQSIYEKIRNNIENTWPDWKIELANAELITSKHGKKLHTKTERE